MKRLFAVTVLGLACLVLPAIGSVQLPQPVLNALTPIDSVPTTQALNDVFGTQALDSLVAIVGDPTVDFGVQLRAIRALPQFCSAAKCQPGDAARDTLLSVLAAFTAQNGVHMPTDLLRVRAAIEALGVATKIPSDVDLLVPFLDNPSRDIRAATAGALRTMCITQAIGPLRARYQHEQVAQVRLAISEALRDLGQPSCM